MKNKEGIIKTKYFNNIIEILELFMQLDSIEATSSIINEGKKRKEVVLIGILSSIGLVLKEIKNSYNLNNLSIFLLIRYIYESCITFQYIFIIEPKKTREKVDAFFWYSIMEHKNILEEDYFNENSQWKNAINFKKGRDKKTWSGKSLYDMYRKIEKNFKKKSGAKYHKIIYKHLSVFSHPTLFQMEILFGDNIKNKKLIDINIQLSCAYITEILYQFFVERNETIKSVKLTNKTKEKIINTRSQILKDLKKYQNIQE